MPCLACSSVIHYKCIINDKRDIENEQFKQVVEYSIFTVSSVPLLTILLISTVALKQFENISYVKVEWLLISLQQNELGLIDEYWIDEFGIKINYEISQSAGNV